MPNVGRPCESFHRHMVGRMLADRREYEDAVPGAPRFDEATLPELTDAHETTAVWFEECRALLTAANEIERARVDKVLEELEKALLLSPPLGSA